MEKTLNQLFGYFAYEQVVVRINSPGGDLGALSHILQSFEDWRGQGRVVHTQATFTAASAGAMLLALGHVGSRLVQRHTTVLFHQSRISQSLPAVTAETATRIAAVLRRSDQGLLNKVVLHVTSALGGVQALCEEGMARCTLLHSDAGEIVMALGNEPTIRTAKWLTAASSMYRECSRKDSWAPFHRHLAKRLAQDVSMPISEAFALNLIDQVWGLPQYGLRRAQHSPTTRRPVLVAA